ncbi:MAG TPA: DUF2254 domain-containing protein, partial [Chloroflexota bacterium]|nr:DUF2254 domain-containing protein [Chloroflexota bacterium]
GSCPASTGPVAREMPIARGAARTAAIHRAAGGVLRLDRRGCFSMRLPNIKNVFGASFWFLPMLLVAGAALTALGLVELEEGLRGHRVSQWPLVLSASPETARNVLSAVTTAVGTIAATTFSLTIVALTLAAQQYTPKMLHNYLSSRQSQVMLGVLAGTFAYALLTLQFVRDNPSFVPGLALTGALGLALASIGTFIYFLHHIASALQDTNIATDLERRTLRASEHLFHPASEGASAGGFRSGVPVPADRESGYIQVIEIDKLAQLMAQHDLVLTVERGAGEFVPRGAALARLNPPERVRPELIPKVCQYFKIGPNRTHQQDVAFGIYQLVDIAVRSLSPSFNAFTTATTCIDHIGSILRQLAPLALPPEHHYARQGKTRVIARSPTFGDLLNLGFQQIRTSGEGHAVILIHLLEVIADLEEVIEDADRRQQLVGHVNHIAAAADRGIPAAVDRQAIGERLQDLAVRLRDAGKVHPLSAQPEQENATSGDEA